MSKKGKIAVWNDEKGYGFIAPDGGGPQIFLHIKALRSRDRRPAVNDLVTYAVGRDKQGRPNARRAALKGEKLATTTDRSRGTPSILIALSFLVAIGFSVFQTGLPVAVPIAYLVLSVLTFLAYARDKSAARKGRWRTSERMLHLLALAGGWPGALIAQQTLRHKSRKGSFRFVLWITVLLNCAVLVWFHTPEGRPVLDQWLAALFDLAQEIARKH
jgi:uncharacterized membrane protein YsdA (DUF1294 family)/cold shock CspA family protein